MKNVQGTSAHWHARMEIRATLCLFLLLTLLFSISTLPQLDAGGLRSYQAQLSDSYSLLVALALPLVTTMLFGLTAIFLQARCKRIESERTNHNFDALHDPLTGVSNRRHFEIRLDELLRENSKDYALIMIDLDRFKPVNDLYGHAAGDALLQGIATGLSRRLKRSDLLARLGGDEFVLLMHSLKLESQQKEALEMLKFIHSYRLDWQDQRISVGASIGVVPLADSTMDASTFLSAADEALYHAKDTGRGAAFMARVVDGSDKKFSIKRIDCPRAETTINRNSYVTETGKTPELYGTLMTWTPPEPTPGQKRRMGSRRRHENMYWVNVEPVFATENQAAKIRMRELLANAASEADGGAELARFILSKTVSTASSLPPTMLSQIGFVIPVPATAVIKDPKLANDLMRINALASQPLRHFTLVLHNLSVVHASPQIRDFCERLSSAGVKLGFEIRSDSLEVFKPMKNLPFDEMHFGPELTVNMSPGSSREAVIESAISVAAAYNMITVASAVNSSQQEGHLIKMGVTRVAKSSAECLTTLRKVLTDIHEQQGSRVGPS